MCELPNWVARHAGKGPIMLESLSGVSWSAAVGMMGARVSGMAAVVRERAGLYIESCRGEGVRTWYWRK